MMERIDPPSSRENKFEFIAKKAIQIPHAPIRNHERVVTNPSGPTRNNGRNVTQNILFPK